MKAKYLMISVVILLVVIGIYSSWNIIQSHSNPHFIEIVFGMIILALLLGPISSLTDDLLKEHFKKHKIVSTILLISCLSIVVFLLLHASTTPVNISTDIPVTYLFSKKNNSMPQLRIYSTETSVCYRDAISIFQKGIEQDPNGLMKIERMLDASGVDVSGFPYKCFPDLTEYLIIYYLGHQFSTPEAEVEGFRGEITNWFALPHENIRGSSQSLEFVEGLTDENMFYGLTGVFPDSKIELRLPENTSISTIQDGGTWKIVIKNKFLKITISVFYSVYSSQGVALVHPSNFNKFPTEIESDSFKNYDMFIRCEAEFNKWKYSYSNMRHQERWAKDVLSKLERRFGWASPRMFNSYYEQVNFRTF